ncbi:hypothetical protein V5N11_030657 [Cardamine amara subsp. amara]|uniref:Uncharacterized protein n=1 Tax=Cardamine amara subsp. amara TaxID=228776 RepID=A0ABD0Z168_CARAN
MEDDRKNIPNSGEINPDTSSSSDFEFGSLTPSSPLQDPFSENSPADHFFLNGRLLPHAFPASTTTTTRSVSRTTSENTFRSNSTSSRSSVSSSPTSYSTPRTSTCNIFKITNSSTGDGENTNLTCFGPRSSEKIMNLRSVTYRRSKEYTQNHHHKPLLLSDLKKKPLRNNGKTINTSRMNKIPYFPQCKRKKATEIVTAQLYGSYSRRWQHITPVFKREGSVKSMGGGIKVGGRKKKKKKKKKVKERRGMSKLMKWWKRIFKKVVFACRECHAMEPQILLNDDDAHDVKRKIIKCP